jgi:hypothetical protein
MQKIKRVLPLWIQAKHSAEAGLPEARAGEARF